MNPVTWKDVLKELYMFLLTAIILCGFYFIGYLIVTGQIKTMDQTMAMLIGTVFGAVSSQTGTVIQYWFGSSSGSAAKDKLIAGNKVEPPKV